ncbi:MAG: DUF4065 domain-containing protein [Candidatus Taylorbacteria bacterium]|nr:DUF4065 domain-containing protein [Candidatus Taylorbacteria bacterium]
MTNTLIKSPYSADNIAKYLIYLASQGFVGDNKEREGITNLKLQKILYFAQAYYLAKLGKALFSDPIEAWGYGPVIPTVYHLYKSKGSDPIISEKDQSCISSEDKENIKKIWDTFGGYSASRLVDIAHAHTPWREANESSSKIISHKAIADYYSPLLNK